MRVWMELEGWKTYAVVGPAFILAEPLALAIEDVVVTLPSVTAALDDDVVRDASAKEPVCDLLELL